MVMTATWVMAAVLVMTAVSVMVMRCEADLPQGGRGVHRVRHRARVRDHRLRRAGGAHPPPPGLLHENARGVFIAWSRLKLKKVPPGGSSSSPPPTPSPPPLRHHPLLTPHSSLLVTV